MWRLNKLTATLYVNENIKEKKNPILDHRIVKPSALMVKQNPSISAAVEVFHITLRELWLDVETKQFDNRYTYDWVNSAFMSLPQYLVSVHSRQEQNIFAQATISKTRCTTRPRSNPCIWNNNKTNVSTKIPWTRETNSEFGWVIWPRSKPHPPQGLPMCNTHRAPAFWKDPQASGTVTASWSGGRTMN